MTTVGCQHVPEYVQYKEDVKVLCVVCCGERRTHPQRSTAYFAGTHIFPATKESHRVYVGTSN